MCRKDAFSYIVATLLYRTRRQRHHSQSQGNTRMTDNGILSRIPGEYVAAALSTLPAPDSTREDDLETEMDVPGVGRLRSCGQTQNE